MAGTPESENLTSGPGTPGDDLNDHRRQPGSLPRLEITQSVLNASRRRSRSTNGEDTGHLSARDIFRPGRPHFHIDSAIEDDESVKSGRRGSNSHPPTLSPTAQPPPPTSLASPSVTFGRPPNKEHFAQLARSPLQRLPSESQKSAPDSDSVDAFAPQRPKLRAGTAESRAPSFITSLRRSISRASHRERPRSFSIDKSTQPDSDDDDDESDTSVEDDVCFPNTEEDDQPFSINFEELEEFALEHTHTMEIPFPFGYKPHPPTEEQKHRIFHGLHGRGPKLHLNGHIKLELHPDQDSDSSDGSDGEKTGAEKVAVDDFDQMRQSETINRWSFFSTNEEDVIHAPELADLLFPGQTFRDLFELDSEGADSEGGGCWWLDVLMPCHEEVEAVSRAFGIHSLTREDIQKQESREKVELFKSYYFVSFRSFYQMTKDSEHYMKPVNVYAIVFREGIITFTFCPSPHAANVRRRMGKLKDYVSLGADWICYALIDDIVDSFAPEISKIERQCDDIEDHVFIARPEDLKDYLHKIGGCRRTVTSLSRLLSGKADVIKSFAKRCNEQYSIAPRQDVGLYLSDIQDHVITMMSNLAHFEKMLARSHSNYLAQIQVDNIIQGSRVNEVLGKVTFIATLLVPLNLVCGLFGMNVTVPGMTTGPNDSLAWWFGIVGFLIFMVIVLFGIAKKMRFL